ncbi:hypothetical protein DESUT3_15630 [Desulfuromonas versatilis]|uniref:Peptidase U32 n=1 Tax=Desulfuromonas versatilis TaxID=2802975 RepID=A0ABM8HRF3_9BACT|nr:hypothetical protein [Desulfuromonas versatilis]BCR04494.1 hypothetical protein DESUT3_15630 [Desulfuromonas versatilis]
MEQALFLNRLEAELPTGISRLYFGSEFCPWTFPRLEELHQALDAARRQGLHFTLATPVAAESFLPVCRAALESLLPRFAAGDELLVSDLGTLHLAGRIAPEATLVLGRALSGQKRGQQILELELNAAQLDYFQRGSWYGAEARALLAEQGVARLELDNCLQGIAPLPEGLTGSLHYPYAMVTSSRNCPFRQGAGDRGCPGGCGEVFTLNSPQSRIPLYQGGNTQFLRNDQLPADLAAQGIDRLVFHPHLPR